MTNSTKHGFDRLNANDAHNGMTRGKRIGRTVLIAGTAAAVALTPTTVSAIGSAISSERASNTVPNPPLDSEHKDIVLGRQYTEPDGTKVTPTDIWSASVDAHLGYDTRAVSDMLVSQVKAEGLDPGALPEGTVLRVPTESAIPMADVPGGTYHPE